MSKIKKFIFDVLDKSEQNGFGEKIFDIIMIFLIISNSLAVIIEPSVIDQRIIEFLRIFEIVSVILFTIEYVLRIWTADLLYIEKSPTIAKLIFILTPMALIDLAAILPFYIPFFISVDLRVLRMLRIFRLTRIFKANRYTKALTVVIKVLKNKAAQLFSSLFVLFVLMMIASVLMFNIENTAQPERFASVFDAMWWSAATVTTVGYGDIYPVTVIGKVLSAVVAVLGIGVVAIPTGIITSGFTEIFQNKKCDVLCPHCGNEININT